MSNNDEFKNIKAGLSLLDGLLGSAVESSILVVILWALVTLGALGYPLWVAFTG